MKWSACQRKGACWNQARRLPITGDIQPEKNLAISGRSAFLGVESRDGESLASAAMLDTFGDALEVLLETQALDLMGACPFVLGSCAGVSTQVAVEIWGGGGGPCTACTRPVLGLPKHYGFPRHYSFEIPFTGHLVCIELLKGSPMHMAVADTWTIA